MTELTPFQQELINSVQKIIEISAHGAIEEYLYDRADKEEKEMDKEEANFRALVARCQEIPVNKGYTCPKGHHTEWVAVGGPVLRVSAGAMEYLPRCKPCAKYYDKEGNAYE